MTENVIIISRHGVGYLVTSPTHPYILTNIDEALALIRKLIDEPVIAERWPNEQQITTDEIDKLIKEG